MTAPTLFDMMGEPMSKQRVANSFKMRRKGMTPHKPSAPGSYKLARGVLNLRPAEPVTCQWKEDDEGNWDTSCGEKWVFTVDGPTENNVRFCHGCGKPVEVVPYVREKEDEDE